MKENGSGVSNSFILPIIIHIYVGWGFLYLIPTAVGHLTHNAYIALLPAAAVILPFFWMAADLAKMFPQQKLAEIFIKVFGNFLGQAVGLIYILFLFFFLSIALRNTHLMIYSYFFGETPFWIITLFFLGGALLSALYGFRAVGRLAAFMLIPPLLVILGLEILALQNINLTNIQPLMEGSWSQWLGALSDLPLLLLPGTAIFVYLPYIRDSQSVRKIGLGSMAVIVPVFLTALIGTIGVFGPNLASKMAWPIVEYFHVADYPYFLLEQTGLLFLIAWYPFHFVATSQGLFVIGNELHAMFPKIRREWHTIGVFGLIYVAVNIPLNVIFLDDFFNIYRRWFTYAYLSVLFATWLVAKFRAGRYGSSNIKKR